MLQSDIAPVREGAMKVLKEMGPAARPLAGKLLEFQNGDAAARCGMIHALARQGEPSPDFLDVLDAALRDDEGYVRLAAINALAETTPDAGRFIPRLIEACDWNIPLHDSSLPECAVEALGAYGPQASAAVPRLMRFVEGPMTGRSLRSKNLSLRDAEDYRRF